MAKAVKWTTDKQCLNDDYFEIQDLIVGTATVNTRVEIEALYGYDEHDALVAVQLFTTVVDVDEDNVGVVVELVEGMASVDKSVEVADAQTGEIAEIILKVAIKVEDLGDSLFQLNLVVSTEGVDSQALTIDGEGPEYATA